MTATNMCSNFGGFSWSLPLMLSLAFALYPASYSIMSPIVKVQVSGMQLMVSGLDPLLIS